MFCFVLFVLFVDMRPEASGSVQTECQTELGWGAGDGKSSERAERASKPRDLQKGSQTRPSELSYISNQARGKEAETQSLGGRGLG